MSFRIETLADYHRREEFNCGVEALNRYFRQQAGQDMRRRVSGCHVCLENESGTLAGYYTLSASGVLLTDLPEQTAKRLPRYPLVPVARLGRLAVDSRFQGQKLGAALLWDAAQRAARSEVVVFALVVDAKDDSASTFYRRHGFSLLDDQGRRLFLPLAGI